MDNQSSKGFGAILLTIIITAAMVAGGMYLWQQYTSEETQQNNEIVSNELEELKNKVENLQNELEERESTDEVVVLDEESTPVETAVAEKTEEKVVDKNIYENEQYSYAVNYPDGWWYKETSGSQYAQLVGFNPDGSPASDYSVLVGVLGVDQQDFLDYLDASPNLKIVRERTEQYGGNSWAAFLFENPSNQYQTAFYTLTINGNTYVVQGEEDAAKVFLNGFLLK